MAVVPPPTHPEFEGPAKRCLLGRDVDPLDIPHLVVESAVCVAPKIGDVVLVVNRFNHDLAPGKQVLTVSGQELPALNRLERCGQRA